MLSSHFESILLEYKQSITAKKMGEDLVGRFNVDVLDFPNLMTPKLEKAFQTMEKIDTQVTDFNNRKDKNEIPAEELTKLQPKIQKAQEQYKILENQIAVYILEKLEASDPTNNKGYVQWLARLYINGETSLEDVESTVAEYLDKFHKLKIKNHLIKAGKADNDIGQYKDYDTFMNAMDQYPNDLIDDDQGKKKKFNADIIYDENGILVVRPNDKEASCRYGRGTRWCTAATRGYNYFDSYTSRGPLYMFMPRRPNHPGEKYQFHFEDGVVADEKDSYLSQNQLIQLASDYPALKDAFQPQAEKFGLIWLQKPKRVHKGSNFNVEEYRKNDKPYYLMKPTDQPNQIYGMENTDEGMKVFNLSDRNSYSSGELNAIQEHDLFNNYPELVTKFGVKGANIVADPVVTNTKNNAKIEQHGNLIVMTDQYGHKTSIDGSDPLEIEAVRTSPFITATEKNIKDRGTGVEDEYPSSNRNYHTLNPYELTLEHPELVKLFGSNVQKTIEKLVKDAKERGAGAKEQRELKEKSLQQAAAYLPYKLYNKGNVTIKSHVTSDGKPVVDYVVDNEKNMATIINRDLRTGEVESIQPYDIDRLHKISQNDNHILHNTQGEEYGNIETQPELHRLYSGPDSRRHENTLDFLPSISFLEQNPELKNYYKNTSLLEPKIKDYPTNIVKNYGTKKLGVRKNRGYYNSIVDDVKSMRNYIVFPKNAEEGESYAISWSPEQPMYVEIYHSDMNGKQTHIDTAKEAQHILKMFPELRNLHEKDYINFIDGTDREPVQYSPYGGSDVKRTGMPEHYFNPTEKIENDRVTIEQYGPNEGSTHELPSFEVKPNEKNPFGNVGDTFFVDLSLKDQRGKYGKISEIKIDRFGKNLYKFEPVDQYGNFKDRYDDSDGSEQFKPVDTKQKFQKTELSPKQVIDFFRYYPELRRLIRDENIHPKVPHPALAGKPDEEGNVETNSVQMGNFTLEDSPSNSPGVEKQFIIPNEPEYEGEFYTLFTYDPHSEPAFKNSETTFTEYGRVKALNDRGFTQLVKGEVEKGNRYHNNTITTQDELYTAYDGRSMGTLTPNTPEYNKLMQRFPDLKELISEKSIEIGDYRTQNISEDNVIELGTERVYTFKNKDGSDLYIITPVGNPLRGEHGEIKQEYESEQSTDRLGTDVGSKIRRLSSDEKRWDEDEEVWNKNSFAVNFESTEHNPYLIVTMLQDPFKNIIDLQVTPTKLDDENKTKIKDQFSTVKTNSQSSGNTEADNYLGKAKKNPELYRWLKEKAEQRNAETTGIGDFINFLDITSEQLTDEQRSVPKVYGIDIVGIAKIGIINPIYLWQGRLEAFSKTENIMDRQEKGSEYRSRPYNERNVEYYKGLEKLGIDKNNSADFRRLADSNVLIKPESDTKFISMSGHRSNPVQAFIQIPNATFLNMGKSLPNVEKIVSKKNLKAMGAIPTQTWGPRQVAGLAPNSKLTNNGKPWIKSIQEFKMPDGLGIEANSYGNTVPHKILPPGTGYLITLNPISSEDGPKKRVDGKLVRQRSPWQSMSVATRGLDLPWDFTHEVLDYGKKENKLLIYFANNRVAYLINPNNTRYSKFNLKQDEKKKLFFDEEYGLFPQLKPIFDQYSKSNKWLRENQIHAIMSKILFEGLGDKTYYELQKQKSKPNYGQLVFLNNIRLTGSYSNEQLKAMGFFMKNGSWAIQKPKYDRLVSDGKLKEMINRPLKTGTNKIPKVGKKKVTEGTWSFDEEGILELLKKPLLRGGNDEEREERDLSCDICQGRGCGNDPDIGYSSPEQMAKELKDYKLMLTDIPGNPNRPDHWSDDDVKRAIAKLEYFIDKYPKGIPYQSDCIAGMSTAKLDAWNDSKTPEVEDDLSDVFGDDLLFDALADLKPTDDVRPAIMDRLEELDPDLYKKALSIYKKGPNLTVVKEGKKLPRTSEFLHVKELEDIKRLSGVYERYQIPVQVEGATSAYSGSNISKTAAEIAEIMKEKNIQPGTPEWFQLWFALPKLTGEKPTGDIK
jgi:hypothetical protein